MSIRLHEVPQSGHASGWLQLDLTVPQIKTLVALWGQPAMRMSSLSQLLGASVSTMTGIVDRLSERGLIERGSDQEDRRIVLVHLSEKGREQISQISLLGQAHIAALLEHIDTEELPVIVQAMEIFLRVAQRLQIASDELQEASIDPNSAEAESSQKRPA
jgi:DNA-binding MarR family transcriptional regulator